jgi:Fe2+ or Zn2+ uptake regulation protein
VISPPPDVSESPRRHSTRHRSRQRDRILSWLQATDSHPTAAEIHEALLPELSALSLGTVYRNLEVLVADGDVEEVPSAVGAKRYDGNVEPHHHFNCERCGRILDVDIPVPSGLTRRLARESGLRANRVQISFTGLCAACTEAPECHEESLNNQNQEEGKTWVT